MKKIILTFAILFTGILYAQKPYVDYQRWGKYTTAEKLAIDVSDTSKVYTVYDSDLGRFQKNAGSGWIDYFSSASTPDLTIPYRQLPVGNTNGNGLTSHPNALLYVGSSPWLEIKDDINNRSLHYPTRFEVRNLNDYSALFYNHLRFQDGVNGAYYIDKPDSYTDGVRLALPNITANDTIAAKSDLSNYVTLDTQQTITERKTFNTGTIDNNIFSVNNNMGSGINSENNSSGTGINSYNAASGIGIRAANDGTGSGIAVFNNSSGSGIFASGHALNSTGYLYVGARGNVNTFTVNKEGDVVANSFTGDGSGLTNLPLSGGTTNLSTTQTPTTVTINSDTGNNATITLADGTNAGVSSNDFTDAEKTQIATNTTDISTKLTSTDIDTFTELDTVVADKNLANLNDAQTFNAGVTFNAPNNNDQDNTDIRIINDNNWVGLLSTNTSTSDGIVSSNNYNSGNAFVAKSNTGSTGFLYVGQNSGSNTFTVNKEGDVTANTFNNVALTTSGSATNFLNEQGYYVAVSGGTTPTLDDVVREGATSTFGIRLDDGSGSGANLEVVDNMLNAKVNVYGSKINFSQDNLYTLSLVMPTLTNSYDVYFQDKAGTVAYLDDLDTKQEALTLTTTGSSGAATLIGTTLNIPQYSGGGDALLAGQNVFTNTNDFNSTVTFNGLVSFTSGITVPNATLNNQPVNKGQLDTAIAGVSGGISNPNEVAITTETDLYNVSNANKDLVLYTDITLTADRTLPTGARVVGKGGKIVFDTFTLTGDKSSYINYSGKTLFNVGFNGAIAGTWEKLPATMTSIDFGVINDGVEHRTASTIDGKGSGIIDLGVSATTLTIPDAQLDASRVGQKIVVFNAGGDDTSTHALITTIASVTNSTTLELTDAAKNIGHNRSLYSTGLNDLTTSGTYTGAKDKEILVEIDAVGTPDTFKWSSDNGATWINGVAITGAAQLLEDGISIAFGATTGHTINSKWKVFGFSLNGVRVFYGTDNYNRIYQGLKNMRSQESGEYAFAQGHYMTELIKKVELSRDPQDGLMAVGDGVTINGNYATLQCFPYKHLDADPFYYKKTDLLQMYEGRNQTIKNFYLTGSYFSDYERNEHNIGIVATTGSYYGKIENVWVREFSGNGIFAEGNKQYTNGIQGANEVSGAFTTGLSAGRILADGTIDAAQTDYVHTTNIVSISGESFDNVFNVLKDRKWSLTADGGGGWGGLTYPEYDMAIYDGDDNFVVLLENVGFYEEFYHVQDNWKKARVMFKDVLNIDDINLRLRSDFSPRALTLTNVNVSYCGQNGFSNLTSGSIWNGGEIHNNGSDEYRGVTTQSGYGGDLEDERRAAQDIIFYNMKFWDNNKGDLAFIGTESIIVDKCFFKKSVRPNWAGRLGINGTFARNLQIRNSDFDHKGIDISRGGIISNVKVNNANIDATGLGCKISDVEIIQGGIRINGTNTIGHNKDFVNTTIDNVTIRMYKEWDDFILSDRNVLGQWSNINIKLNDASILSNLVGATGLNASLTSTQQLWEDLSPVGGQPYGGGFLNNFFVKGHAINNDPTEYGTVASFPGYEWTNNVKCDFRIEIAKNSIGTPNILWENLEATALRINANNGDYDNSVPANPIANPAPKFIFRNAKIINNDGDNALTATSSRFLKIDPYWVDVIFEGGEFVNNVAYTQTLGRSVFAELNNFGKTSFKGSLIGNAGAEDDSPQVFGQIDLSEYWLRPNSAYPLEFIDISVTEGTTFVDDPNGDNYLSFTKGNSLMATHANFADETAAAAANYPQHYWYMTPTGELRVKL